jgi:DMSO/TMAO reductase YedYZ molybdopterin-dependent catalytic subunit
VSTLDALHPEAVLGRLHRRITSPLHDDRVAAQLGLALGVLFTTCAVTGAYSHLQQHPISWLPIPPRPTGLYRLTQGIHVTSGFASIPVLLAKLWVVSPKLVEWPAVKDARHLLERLALLPLVGGGVFLLFSGVANTARWYPWHFYFPAAHYWTAWIAIGAMVVHIGATWTTSGPALRRRGRSYAERFALGDDRRDRRRFLRGVAAASGVLVVGSVGATITSLSPLAYLGQRRSRVGPQGLPVNKTARQARVLDRALDPGWRLHVDGNVERELSLSLADLQAMAQHEAELPIACVEGWSASARWSGVPIRALLARAGADAHAYVRVHSMQTGGRYFVSELNRFQAHDRDTLLATGIDGEVLHPDHGFPARLIAPNRPGVEQTKWVGRLEVV